MAPGNGSIAGNNTFPNINEQIAGQEQFAPEWCIGGRRRDKETNSSQGAIIGRNPSGEMQWLWNVRSLKETVVHPDVPEMHFVC